MAIVEPYFSGALLPERFREQGYDCIAIHLRPVDGKAAASFRAGDYIASIVHDGDFAGLVRALESYALTAVVPGIEGGVLLADALAARFGLPGNDPARSLARRDKYVMHQQIAASGLRSIEQVRFGDQATLAAWLRTRDQWPVVIKPALSGATDGVRVCETPAAAEAAFCSAIGQINALGVRNDMMIAQDYIAGTEFVVDAVSCNGQHEVVNLAYYRKERSTSGAPIYREMFFVPPDEWAVHAPVVDYAKAVLDALGITVGPSHTEIFVDEQGPVLVESAARLCGAMVPLYLDAVAAVSPLDLVVSSYVDTASFETAIIEPQQHDAALRAYFLRNGKAGRVAARPGDDLLRTVKTFKDVIWYASVGSAVVPTQDLWSGLGLVFLISPDEAAIDEDVDRIRQWESDDRFITVDS